MEARGDAGGRAPGPLRLEGIRAYPVKAAAALELETAEVEPAGLQGDRAWMVVDAGGKALTQRDEPRLALVRVEHVGPGSNDAARTWRLSAPGAPTLVLRPGRARREVVVWGDVVDALAGDEASARWISDRLGRPCAFACADARSRRVANAAAGEPVPVRFPDALPLLVTTTASLAELNRVLPRPVPMERFRANLVVAGAEPFEEDLWRRIRVGAVEVELLAPCGRCVVTTTDQRTAERDPDGEPLRTLAAFRRTTRAEPLAGEEESGVFFGWRGVARTPGRVRLGDPVEVLERRPAATPAPGGAPPGRARR